MSLNNHALRQSHVFASLSKSLVGVLLSVWLTSVSCNSKADTVELSPAPVMEVGAQPNVVLTMDASANMRLHFSPNMRPYQRTYKDPEDRYWSDSLRRLVTFIDPEELGRTYPADVPYLCAGVIVPGITPREADPFDARTWSMNGVYYNPDVTYVVPLRVDGASSMPQANYNQAWDDGIYDARVGRPGNRNLAAQEFCGNLGGGYYQYNGSRSSLVLDGNNALTEESVNRLYTPGNWTWVPLTTAAEKQNFANWYSYYRTRARTAITVLTHVMASLKGKIRLIWQGSHPSVLGRWLTTDEPMYKFDDSAEARNSYKRFFDFLYSMSTPNGGGLIRETAWVTGNYFTNRTGATDSNPYWDRDTNKELTCRQNFHILMAGSAWSGGSEGYIGIDFDYPPEKIRPNLRTNTPMPDGMQAYTTTSPENKIFWNEDPRLLKNYYPPIQPATLADIVFKFWATDLQAGVGGNSMFASPDNRRKIKPYFPDKSTPLFGQALAIDADPRTNKEIYWNPANDPATWPHLVHYVVGIGATGSIAHASSVYSALREGRLAWTIPNPHRDTNEKMDDLWRAGLVGRGGFFNVNSPQDLINAFNAIINNINARNSSSVAGSLSTSVLVPTAVNYLVGYDTADWTGYIRARSVDSQGILGKVSWNAGTLLDQRSGAANPRVILTSTGVGAGKGAPFTWAAAGGALKTVDPNFDERGIGEKRVAWLRGDKAMEGTLFRRRNSLLGPVINAQALYVGAPASGYRDSWPEGSAEAAAAQRGDSYESFRTQQAKRAPTIYVGANDGMLHAIDATTADTHPALVDVTPSPGAERWAYVPYSVYGRLAPWSSLTHFNFMPSVDGAPVSRDIYFNSGSGSVSPSWRTILVAGLRLGGRGIYALDITEVASTEGSTSGKVWGPAQRVLWEFNNTSPGGENLGYTYGRPNIARLANGKWVVLVPSGYFPNGSLDKAARNDFSSLFVLDASTGALIRELKTPSQVSGIGAVVSSGLTTPVLGDYNGDQVDDVAFAGDLQGNIWRFDLTDESPANWKINLLFRPKNPGDRPVTVMPRLFPNIGYPGFTVVFGTGKYLGSSDSRVDASSKVQAVYGIRDTGRASQDTVVEGQPATPLIQQHLIEKGGIRGLSSHAVPAINASGVAVRGWYFDLDIADARGERVVVDASALFNTNRAIISTLIPQGSDPCSPEAKGALMVIDAVTGGAGAGVNFGDVPDWSTDFAQAGVRVTNPPTGGSLPVATAMGGGQLFVPGLNLEKDPGKTFSFGDAVWRRRSWRVLNNDQ